MTFNLLLISFHYPPCSSVGGSIRASKFVSYMPVAGIFPLVVSSSASVSSAEEQFSVVRLRSILPFTKPFNLSPIGWIPSVLFETTRLIEKYPLEVILVTSPPFPAAFVYAAMRTLWGKPLVVDFRDPWTLAPFRSLASAPSRLLSSYINPMLERIIFKRADLILMNTPSMLAAYAAKYPFAESKLKVLTNGFDEADFDDSLWRGSHDEMRILFAGSMAVDSRDPRWVIESVARLRAEGLSLRLIVLGEVSKQLSDFCANNTDLNSAVEFRPPAKHEAAVREMYEADVLLSYDEEETGPVSRINGKLFEYIRTRKPIVIVARDGDATELVRRYSVHHRVVSDYKRETLECGVRELYQEWKAGGFVRQPELANEFSLKYSRENLAKSLAESIKELSSR